MSLLLIFILHYHNDECQMTEITGVLSQYLQHLYECSTIISTAQMHKV